MTLNNATTATQISEILAYLQSGKGLTQSECTKLFGSQRLASRIWDIRQKGIEVWYVWEHGQNRHNRRVDFKRYFLDGHQPKNAELENTKPKVNKAQTRYEAATKFLYTDPDFWKSIDIDPLKLEKALKIAAGIKPNWQPCGTGENICNCKTPEECGYKNPLWDELLLDSKSENLQK